MESNEQPQAASQQAVLYRAVGWVAGTYQPSSKAYQGFLLTEDGQTIPANLLWRLRQYLKSKYPDYRTEPDFFNSPYQWIVYPLTDPLRFQLAVLRLPIHSESGEAEKEAEADLKRPLNQFRIVGEIESFADGTVSICVRSNEPAPKGKEDNPEYQPFTLALSGSLPTASVGENWELEARREGSRLVVTAGRLYQPSAEDLLWIQKHQQQSTRKKAIKSGNKAVDAADTPPATQPDTPPATKAIAPAAETLVDSKEPVASPTAATESTHGKLEVVVKLNQFPDDVRTVDNRWKEFEVDTGDCAVTITVKPKVFATLEQATTNLPVLGGGNIWSNGCSDSHRLPPRVT